MAQIPNLDYSPLDLKSIREQSQRELVNVLRNIRGKKCLVIDTNLSGSISLIVQTAILKEHGAELRLLGGEPMTTDCNKIVYLVRSQFKLMNWICSHVQHDMSKGLQREYYLYFVPRREVACEKVLEDEKVHNLFTFGEFPFYSVPLDEDIISFELDMACKEIQVDGDTSSLWHIAKAIHKLELSFGLIPNVRAKGKASVRVGDILSRLQMEDPVNANDVGFHGIDTVVLLDREVDMVTPMCTQLTYEGLIDEFLSIKNGCVEVDSSVMGGQQDGKKTKIPLNSSDKLFKETRDLNFEVVIQVLRQKAVSMKQDYSEMTTTNQSVSELKDFVKKLNSLPEITRHINLAQHLSTFTSKPSFLSKLEMEHAIIDSESYEECFDNIETLIYKQEPLVNVLRILVLFSLTNGGIPKKLFDPLRREILHSYGFEYTATLNSLEKSGLLKRQDAKNNWLKVKHSLRLIVEDTNTFNPNDIAYVFSGYAPLSVRLIQHAIKYGWRPIEDILRLLPGPHSDTKRSASPSVTSTEGSSLQERDPNGRRSIVLVVFIGGVTLAEISALRFLTSQETMSYDVIIATTKIVNGNSLMETYLDK